MENGMRVERELREDLMCKVMLTCYNNKSGFSAINIKAKDTAETVPCAYSINAIKEQ